MIHDNLQAYSKNNGGIAKNRVLENFFIGACSGVFSTIITFPIDTVRVMMATDQGSLKQITKTVTVKRAYSGITSGIIGVSFYAGLLFGSRDIICDILLADERSRKNWFDENLQKDKYFLLNF